MKEVLHLSTATSKIVCRDDEQKRIVQFCKWSLGQKKAGSLYICGDPGTGKSLSMENVKGSLAVWAKEVISVWLFEHFEFEIERMMCCVLL